MRAKKCIAQSLMEYTLFISVIAAAFLAMQTYVRRGIQGAVRDRVEDFGNQSFNTSDFESGQIYEPLKGEFTNSTSVGPTDSVQQLRMEQVNGQPVMYNNLTRTSVKNDPANNTALYYSGFERQREVH